MKPSFIGWEREVYEMARFCRFSIKRIARSICEPVDKVETIYKSSMEKYDESWANGLSTRARRILWVREIYDREELLKRFHSGELSDARDCGVGTIREISIWLGFPPPTNGRVVVDPNSVPPEILKSILNIKTFFASRGISKWSCDGIKSK